LAARARVGGEAVEIEREVLRRLAPGIRPDLIKVAGGDALEQRKSRW
jgi:hypothetical protein